MRALSLCPRVCSVAVCLLLAFTSGVASATPANNSNTLGLVAAWEFSGNANDVSGNGNDGVVHGATPTTDRFGNANSAYSFDGVNDYIRIPNSLSFDFSQTKEISFGAWVNLNAHTGGNIVGQNSPGSHFAFAIDTYSGSAPQPNRIEGAIHVTNPQNWEIVVSPDEISLNDWHHLFVTADEEFLRLYVDGTEVVAGGLGGDWIANTYGDDVLIGAFKHWATSDSVAQFSDGKIDDVYVYSRALSPAEVLTLATIPEPSTALLLGIGLAGLGMKRRRVR